MAGVLIGEDRWRAELHLDAGGVLDVPVVGWMSYGADAYPFFVPQGGKNATMLTEQSVKSHPEWGITDFTLYHPDVLRKSRTFEKTRELDETPAR